MPSVSFAPLGDPYHRCTQLHRTSKGLGKRQGGSDLRDGESMYKFGSNTKAQSGFDVLFHTIFLNKIVTFQVFLSLVCP